MDFKIKSAILLALWDLSTYQPLLTVLLFYQLWYKSSPIGQYYFINYVCK